MDPQSRVIEKFNLDHNYVYFGSLCERDADGNTGLDCTLDELFEKLPGVHLFDVCRQIIQAWIHRCAKSGMRNDTPSGDLVVRVRQDSTIKLR